MNDSLLQDIRYALRMLSKRRLFAATAVLTIGIGIAATTTVFSLVTAMLFGSPDGMQGPAQLYSLYLDNRSTPQVDYRGPSIPMFKGLREMQDVFTDILLFARSPIAITVDQHPETLNTEAVTGNYFSLLGVKPAIGRLIEETDDKPGAPPVAVVSYHFWRTRYDGAPNVLGRTLLVSGQPFTIVGIAPDRYVGMLFDWYEFPEVWIPLESFATIGQGSRLTTYGAFHPVIGRLKPGVDPAAAKARISTFATQLYKDPLDKYRPDAIPMIPISQARINPTRRDLLADLLTMLSAVSLLILLAACFNVANFLLGQAAVRRHEVAVRIALGASRMRIVRQLMTESLLISLVSAVAGLALTAAMFSAIRTLPRVFDRISLYAPPLDLRVLGFATALGIVCTLLIGLLPALTASTRDTWMLIRESASGRWSGFRFSPRQLLLVVQVMLAVVLAVTGGLFARTLYNLVKVDPGFPTDHILMVDVNSTLLSADERTQFNRDLLPSVKAIPGVISVTAVVNPPFLGLQPVQQVQIPDRDSTFANMSTLSVTPDFFDTLGLRVISGRIFTDAKADLDQTIVVNETFAKNMWGGQPAVGKTIFARSGTVVAERQIIGVVSLPNCWDHLQPPDPCMFNPIAPRPARVLLIRAQDLAGLPSKVRDAVQKMNRNVLVENVRTMNDHLRERIAGPRLAAFTAAGLAAVGVILVAIGCFAVFSAMVKESSREIALRLALGASHGRLLRQILIRATMLATIGAAAGLIIAAFVVNRFNEQLFQMKAHDTLVFAMSGVGVLVLAILATFYPARTAATTDPSSALKVV